MNCSTRVLFVSAVAVGMLLSCNAFAGTKIVIGTGNELIQYCTHHNFEEQNEVWHWCEQEVYGLAAGFQAGYYIGYVAASDNKLTDAQMKELVIKANQAAYGCQAGNITRQQDALVVSEYLLDHPEDLNELDWILVVAAFHKAWPCAKQ